MSDKNPLNYRVMNHASVPQEKISAVESLLNRLKNVSTLPEKIQLIDQVKEVQNFFNKHPLLKKAFCTLAPMEQYAVKSILALDQGDAIFKGIQDLPSHAKEFRCLIHTLLEVEKCYEFLGGIIGYHLTILKLIAVKEHHPIEKFPNEVHYHHPIGTDFTKDTFETRKAIRWGIESLAGIGELYPVGGSGDRLHLHDTTGEALPVAALNFCGKSLLEGMIQDLQGREYLHYKIHAKQTLAPIAMMTSEEKNNHQQILDLCNQHQWFGRGRENFKLFTQPLVPVITIKGDWVVRSPLYLLLKPGGHGIIWKLALEEGVIDWMIQHGSPRALVRQINNPIAGIDFGLLAFAGLGAHYNKSFGFSSCYRLLNTAEGMNILVEEKVDNGVQYRISNIEYTEFARHHLKDEPETPGSSCSKFPSNTNILFADLSKLKSIIKSSPIPGLLINMKTSAPWINAEGKTEQIPAGRLESTMQNLADFIIDKFPAHKSDLNPNDLTSFITFNERRKTLSVCKKVHVPEKSMLETPEGAFYELLQNHYELFTHHCKMDIPKLNAEKDYLHHGPSFMTSFHPALGPLFEVIAQKIRGGHLRTGAELKLEIAELDLENLQLEGSLQIISDRVLGHVSEGRIIYSENTGKCTLHNVIVHNRGINRSANNHFWSHSIHRHESMRILLRGNAEFVAENMTFSGPYDIVVPDKHRMTAYLSRGRVEFRLEEIDKPTWWWIYSYDDNNRLQLTRLQNSHH